jgi:hypothetical protein
LKDSTWHTIDATLSLEEIQSQIQKITEDALKKFENQPVRELWVE